MSPRSSSSCLIPRPPFFCPPSLVPARCPESRSLFASQLLVCVSSPKPPFLTINFSKPARATCTQNTPSGTFTLHRQVYLAHASLVLSSVAPLSSKVCSRPSILIFTMLGSACRFVIYNSCPLLALPSSSLPPLLVSTSIVRCPVLADFALIKSSACCSWHQG